MGIYANQMAADLIRRLVEKGKARRQAGLDKKRGTPKKEEGREKQEDKDATRTM